MKKRRARFSEIELQIIEESLKRNISPPEIAKSLGRDEGSVRKKIWQMGWKSQYAIERKKLTTEERQIFKDRAKAREQEEAKEAKGLRSSMHPYLDVEWQEVLIATGAKISDWKGQRVLVMDGMPTSVQAIKAKYEKIMAASQASEEDPVDASPYQATHQNTAKVVRLR